MTNLLYKIFVPRNEYLPGGLLNRREEYDFALVDDWDGNNAKAIAPSTLRSMQSIISEFGTWDHIVEISPGRDGSISATWEDGNGHYVYLSIGDDKTLHLYNGDNGQKKWEGVSLVTDRRILARLQEAFSYWRPLAGRSFSYTFTSQPRPVIPLPIRTKSQPSIAIPA
ncbi:hypothetical protein EB235_19070 [Mesorhizobium loti R88b]|uniref:Uncharacterized protein n=1 Tax=Mesorhizobium loti R88b TaxID=935548 RepID=A0A6M7WHC5_RHILI|nr:hypothetical protein EB235_19070 [Mesorhizobium loti R88b]